LRKKYALAEDEKETKHLEEMEGAKSGLRLFQMDLLDSDSIAAALKGCSGVIHLACPNIIGQVQDPEVLILVNHFQITLPNNFFWIYFWLKFLQN